MRISIALTGQTITAIYRCDRCQRTTDQHRMRLRPIQPIPETGEVRHECSACVSAAKSSPARSPKGRAETVTDAPPKTPGLWDRER